MARRAKYLDDDTLHTRYIVRHILYNNDDRGNCSHGKAHQEKEIQTVVTRQITVKTVSDIHLSSFFRFADGANLLGNKERRTFITTQSMTDSTRTKRNIKTRTKAALTRNLIISHLYNDQWQHKTNAYKKGILRHKKEKQQNYAYAKRKLHKLKIAE